MFKSWPKFLVILLVASLQCVAPLIHAHTNSAADHHEYSHSEGSAPALHPVLGEDHQHGETIGVAKEYKRDYTLVFFATATLLSTPLPFQAISPAPDRVQPLPPPVNRHTRPSPQAP